MDGSADEDRGRLKFGRLIPKPENQEGGFEVLFLASWLPNSFKQRLARRMSLFEAARSLQ